MRPINKTKSPPRGSLPRHTEKSTEKSTEKLTRQVLPTSQRPTRMQSTETLTNMLIKLQLKLTIESTTRCRLTSIPRRQPRFYSSRLPRATMKSTGLSPKRKCKDENPFTQHLRVNAICRGLPAARCTLQSMRKHCTELRQR